MLRAFAALLAALLFVLIVGACGGDDFSSDGGEPPGPCNEDPWSCGDQQTCWVNQGGDGFMCLNSGGAEDGRGCGLYAGTPTCRSGLFCGPIRPGCEGEDCDLGTCTHFCNTTDTDRRCPDNLICVDQPITNPETMAIIGNVSICLP